MRRTWLMVAWLLMPVGCATTFSGPTQRVSFASTPSDARVVVDGIQQYRSPASIELMRRSEHAAAFQKSGFASVTVPIDQRLNGLFWLNFLWGPAFFIGMITDASTGAMWALVPDSVQVQLIPEHAAVSGVAP